MLSVSTSYDSLQRPVLQDNQGCSKQFLDSLEYSQVGGLFLGMQCSAMQCEQFMLSLSSLRSYVHELLYHCFCFVISLLCHTHVCRRLALSSCHMARPSSSCGLPVKAATLVALLHLQEADGIITPTET